MTEQREFPFFVNGRFWKTIVIDESIIRCGRMEYAVMTHSLLSIVADSDMGDMMATMKKVTFQIVELCENKADYRAHWFSGFWLCDNEVYLEEGNIYIKSKEIAGND